MSEPQAIVLLLTPDLIFGSRVQGAAARCGVAVAATPAATKLLEVAADQTAQDKIRMALVDLNNLQVDLSSWIDALRGHVPELPVVAFGSHVLEEKLAEARQSGCSQVLTRGQFDQQMQTLLAGVASS